MDAVNPRRYVHRTIPDHRRLSLHGPHPEHGAKALHPTLSGHGKHRVKPPHSDRPGNLSHRMTCMKGRAPHAPDSLHSQDSLHSPDAPEAVPAAHAPGVHKASNAVRPPGSSHALSGRVAPDACGARPAKETRRGSFPAPCHPLALSGRLRPLSGFAFVRNIAPGTPFRCEVSSGGCPS